MYVHTHWAYNHPYAARTWTLEDWDGYLKGLRTLDYDFLLFWPQFDCMSPAPNESDRIFLAKIAKVIDLAHKKYGMKFMVCACPNTIGNEKALEYKFEERPYFICEQKLNPGNKEAIRTLIEGRRKQFKPIGSADGLVVIDSDPGGYPGSTNEEFVNLMKLQIDIFREYNPKTELFYWLWVGWAPYCKFWKKIADSQNKAEGIMHEIKPSLECFVQTLELIKEQIPEPWSLFVSSPLHMEATEKTGLEHKRLYNPYGAIESEPTFPLTNYLPDDIAGTTKLWDPKKFPKGIIGNAQTHCLQLPNTYIFSEIAKGRKKDEMDLRGFAEKALPGHGDIVAASWEAIGKSSAREQKALSKKVRGIISEVSGSDPTGFLFGDPKRFLDDLAYNLEIRAALHDLKEDISSGGKAKKTLKNLLEVLGPYQKKLGYADAYHGPLMEMLNDQVARLTDKNIARILAQFKDWRNPAIRNGIVPRFFKALEEYCANPDIS